MTKPMSWVGRRGERGQTATEYVLVTAVAASLAIGITWLLLAGTMQDALTLLGAEVTDFISEAF
jgi:hypothetical protein